jgi:hypothetical protein
VKLVTGLPVAFSASSIILLMLGARGLRGLGGLGSCAAYSSRAAFRSGNNSRMKSFARLMPRHARSSPSKSASGSTDFVLLGWRVM